MGRECGTCTKCCEGTFSGSALGQTFYPGKPCHFLSIGKGCTVYSKRPEEPCKSYECLWLTNTDIPEWMKPNEINAIVDIREVKKISYLNVTEAGARLDSRVLSWLFQYAITNNLNFCWEVDGGKNWIGTPEFNIAFKEFLKK